MTQEIGRRLVDGVWVTDVQAEGSGGGGSQTLTTNASLTANRAGAFVASHVFDLGAVCAFYIVSTITASDADGETWGTDPGDIAIDVENLCLASDDGVTFVPVLATTTFWYHDTVGGPDDALFSAAGVTARYLKVLNFRIIDSDFNVYAGANDPTVTARFDVSYR